MSPEWLEYGGLGLLALFFVLIAYKVLPENRKAQEKRDDTFADALKNVEQMHSEDTERVIEAHHQTIEMLVSESTKRHEVLQKVSDNQEEIAKLMAANTEVIRQIVRDPKSRTRMSDSQRRAIGEEDRRLLEEARRTVEGRQ